MPAVPPPGGQIATRSGQINYYASYLAKLPGTYKGNYKKYDGMTWADLYRSLAAANPSADPRQLADAVLGVEAAQRTGQGIQAAGNELGQFASTTDKALADTNFAGPAGGLLGGIAAIGDFFARLTEASTWLRIGEGVLGIILIAVGVARLTHAVPIATKIAGAVA